MILLYISITYYILVLLICTLNPASTWSEGVNLYLWPKSARFDPGSGSKFCNFCFCTFVRWR